MSKKQLDLADAQFIGFIQGRSDSRIISLVQGMGLTKREWEEYKASYPDILSFADKDEIDDYFSKRK